MSKLYFRYSAMGAGKSLDLLKVAYNYEERGMSIVIYNSKLDTRFANGCVASRAGLQKDAALFDKDSDFLAMVTDLPSKPHCVLVDESQFLTKEQVSQLCKLAHRNSVPVICYGLRTDFMGNLFEGSTWLLAWSDTIEELKTICWCGKKATQNARTLDGEIVRTGDQIQIGGNESYIALCWEHYLDGNIGA